MGGSLTKMEKALSVMSTSIKDAASHGIKVNLVKPNKADGNFIFESVVDNMNSR